MRDENDIDIFTLFKTFEPIFLKILLNFLKSVIVIFTFLKRNLNLKKNFILKYS